ncbi:adenylosuccinate synthase [Aciduliprofundum sp. MAR08-339]|uniref:adenylosuccinate synthase n=1 Tax=Aciduliprofundum sp. (strain MAR08-339) TaxID=673860 RepID=UPI00064EB3CA
MNVAVIGLQFGDEGKGKIVDFLSKDFDIIARFSGGSNAGHSVVHDGKKFKLHLIPSGVLRGKIGVLGNGMVVDLEALKGEVEILLSEGIEPKLVISSRAHVVTSFHREVEVMEDELIGIGTTRRGIGPTYETKAKRVGLRMGDLFYEDMIFKRLELMTKLWGIYDDERVRREARKLHALALEFKESVKNTELWLNAAMDSGKSVLFEGSQAVLLDIDFGTYPYVTSSNTIVGGICTGLGVSPRRIHRVIGVMKPYMTRVGSGPFPTEIFGEYARELREKGGEYGATTGRPRRVGWLDMPLLRYATLVGAVDEIALTKVDVIYGMKNVPVAWEYRCSGENNTYPPYNFEECEPVYREYGGWDSIEDEEFREFISMIEGETGARVKLVSYGADRENTRIID